MGFAAFVGVEVEFVGFVGSADMTELELELAIIESEIVVALALLASPAKAAFAPAPAPAAHQKTPSSTPRTLSAETRVWKASDPSGGAPRARVVRW